MTASFLRPCSGMGNNKLSHWHASQRTESIAQWWHRFFLGLGNTLQQRQANHPIIKLTLCFSAIGLPFQPKIFETQVDLSPKKWSFSHVRGCKPLCQGQVKHLKFVSLGRLTNVKTQQPPVPMAEAFAFISRFFVDRGSLVYVRYIYICAHICIDVYIYIYIHHVNI